MAFTSRLHLRLVAVLASCMMILSTLGALAYVMASAFNSMAETADQIDGSRALTAARGALTALKKQLGATVRDNAYWDDAYARLNLEGAAEWAVENWGSMTADYPLYDTALVIASDNKPLIAYHRGSPLKDAEPFFLGKLGEIVAAARRAGFHAKDLPVAFVKTRDGVALIGAAAIQPSVDDPDFDISNAKVLVFAKQLTPHVVAEIADTFSVQGLSLTDVSGSAAMLHADVSDVQGREIARMTWPAMRPGTASYVGVQPTIIGAGVVLLLLLAAVSGCGFIVFRGLRDGARSATYKAKHDALTGLWNRAGCLDQLDEMLTSSPDADTTFHILDLDGFKPVNDAWGHPVGDRLIEAVAARLLAALPSKAVVARLGGDEFAIMHQASESETDERPLFDTILSSLAAPFMIDGRTIEIGGSIGWVKASTSQFDGVEILRRADLALYRAKDLGRGIAVGYEPSLDEDAGKRCELEQELRQGLARGDVRVVFQPLIEAASMEVMGVEALARWASPTRGPVSPELFIAVAEKAGLIDQLGFQVLESALREGLQWPGIGVAVNISPLQLRNPYFCKQVSDALSKSAFDPSRLTIEVTEGVLISNPDQAKRAFKGLHELGVKISLDDFGCGYASIGTLREFGFDSMKIDRSLVVALDQDENGAAVLHATVALANALHLPVTAEGIETEEQATVVRLSGCDRLQGYLFSKPVSAEEITSRYFPLGIARTG